MKESKLREAVENVTTFGEAFDLISVFYNSKNHNFHMTKGKEGWICKVMKVKKVVTGKDVEYKESFLLRETGDTFVEAFKNGAMAHLK